MPIDVTKPLAWKTASTDETEMLRQLQGNILKGHGRNFTYNLFLRFDHDHHHKARHFVRQLAGQVTPALKQLQDADAFKLTRKDGGLFTAFFLTAAGYRALGHQAALPQQNAAPFLAGLKARGATLSDPPPEVWSKPFRADIHAMVLIADNNDAVRDQARDAIIQLIKQSGGAVTLLGTEEGRGMRNADGEGIEHFGYVDGRSQPLMLVEDIDDEKNNKGGIDQWNPEIPLGQVLVPCPGGGSANSFGSYFVFRKLEQNVRGFKSQEVELADFLGLAGKHRELAGAMVIGRFENGTPAALSAVELPVPNPGGVPNNFNFRSDPNGLKCPFAGHIRKSNPRGESVDKIGPIVGNEKRHLMARRGITYGRRGLHPNDPQIRFDDMPTGDVGLLFMAYQSNIEDQFEFTQQTWVNNADFVANGTGIDPVIGQGHAPNGQKWPDQWGTSLKAEPFDFSRWVRLRGGEYFFAPSIPFLHSV